MERSARALAAAALLATGALAQDAATVTMSTTIEQANPISQRMVGFSTEVSNAANLFAVGGRGGSPRKSYANLMNLLREASGAAAAGDHGPNIRIGGNSADESVYLPGNDPLPTNDTYRITDEDLQLYATAVPSWNGTVTLDTNFRDPKSPTLALNHVKAAGTEVGWDLIEGVEIGNEVDLFHQNGIRPGNYDYKQYSQEFDTYVSAIVPLFPGGAPRIQGATWCCGAFDASWGDYLDAYGKYMSSISYHRYPESNCHEPKNTPTVAALMNDKASVGVATSFLPLVQTANAAGVPFVIGEGNTVSCGGYTNVSDVFASALWAMDILFNMAAINTRRWNFHGGTGGPYAPITYPDVTQDVPVVRPMFYGLWAFAAATANASVLYRVSVSTNNLFVKAYAVKDGGGTWRVVVIHKDPTTDTPPTSAAVTIAPLAPLRSAAEVVRLLPGAAGIFSRDTDPITFGGQTFLGSQDGRPVGTPTSESVAPNGLGSFIVNVPRASAAIVTLPSA